jgi:PIN domain nuclease of toxin-antitoxin system
VRLLLDTHACLWWLANDARMGSSTRQTIQDSNIVFVSAASAWEVAIKVALGKLETPGPFTEAVEACGFTKLPITFEHAERAAGLPRHHGDPFDRMLVAQAFAEGLALVTHDRRFQPYGVTVVWE